MDGLLAKAKELSDELSAAGVRVEVDSRREKPGWKYNYWEVRGAENFILGYLRCQESLFALNLVKEMSKANALWLAVGTPERRRSCPGTALPKVSRN
jgi:hypothetical protein